MMILGFLAGVFCAKISKFANMIVKSVNATLQCLNDFFIKRKGERTLNNQLSALKDGV